MAINRRLMRFLAIFAILAMIMAVHPATASAAPEPEELFRAYSCKPNHTPGNGTGVIFDTTTGIAKMRPEMETYISKEGGTCKFWAGNHLTVHMSSPAEVIVETNNVKYAASPYLIATGLEFTFTFKAGDNIKGWQLNIWYSFAQVDPFARVNYPAAPPANYFESTGHAIDNLFIKYWQEHGGLEPYGLPISEKGLHFLSGRLYEVQYFERARFEYHPENANPFTIQLGQFGRQVMEAQAIQPTPAQPDKDHTCWYDPNTSHNVCGYFGDYWKQHGGLAQFGRPLTEPFKQELEDGNTYQVQYFERARFEYHPENPAPYNVQLGQFGRYVLGNIRAIRLESSGKKP